MRVLITGAGGFVGQHLTQHLLQASPESEIHGTIITERQTAAPVHLHTIDLKDESAVHKLIAQVQPVYIYHLAAQSSPRRSFIAPWETLENNIRSQLNIIEACLKAGIRPRILIVSSGEIYGADDNPINEDNPLHPTSPYSVSKITQDMLGLQYYISDQLPVVRVRPFNHTGPGQPEGFVAPDFAMQIARIEANQQPPIMEVGNLAAQRDFTDVRDVVHAYHLALTHGTPGAVYNVASGRVYSIQRLLDTLLSYSSKSVEVRTDPKRALKADAAVKCGDASRLREATGWQPAIPFEQTLHDLLNDCRQRVRGNPA